MKLLKNIGIGISMVVAIAVVPAFFAWLTYVGIDAFLLHFQDPTKLTPLANQFRWYAATFCAGAAWMGMMIMFAVAFNEIFEGEKA